jgi:hypothetical protein
MKADAYDLRKIFGFDRQLFAPLFQRPYVWSKERQWEPLWNDIKTLAEQLCQGKLDLKPHFLGAVVLDQIRVPVGKPDARSIIDGQQRLTTLQIFLAAFRDICNGDPELKKLSMAAEQLMFNSDPMVESENDRLKLWPTNVDREPYRVVMTAGSPQEVRKRVAKDGVSESGVTKAYRYFWGEVSEWANSDGSDTKKKLEALLHTLRQKLRLVIIDMDSDDDAQIIFETLNARGTPLLPSDLVKNYLFHRAQQESADVESLYKLHWEPFDKGSDFWRREVRQGRLMRPVIDLFLQHYLSLMKNDDVSAGSLFVEFQRLAERDTSFSASDYLVSLQAHSGHFHKFFNMPRDTREGIFFYRLKIMDTTTVFPFLLGLYQDLDDREDGQEDKIGILEDLESFLVRRMICRLTAKNYNRLFLDLLVELRSRGSFSRQSARNFLLAQTAESSRWPDDEEFKRAWLSTPFYMVLTRPRLRMVLRALDGGLCNQKTESYYLKEELTVEHIMPQHWEEHWPFQDLEGTPDAGERILRQEHRNSLTHTIGNLTLLTKSLNPFVSNGPFERKKRDILEHSALNLNRFLMNHEVWGEEGILERGNRLFEIAGSIWQYPH